MTDYGAAFKRPFTDLKKLVIGIVLSWIPIVNFFALGYQWKCAKLTMEKKKELPEWTEWGNLIIKGVVMAVISIIYFLPILIIGGIVAMGSFAALLPIVLSGDVSGLGGLIAGLGLVILLLLLLGILIMYVLPSAMMMYVREGTPAGSFKLGEVFRNAFNVDYFVVWIVTMVYALIAMIILSFIPFIGTGIATFITGVTEMTLFAEIYPAAVKKK